MPLSGDVICCSTQEVGVIVEHAQAEVTVSTEQAAKLAGLVVVVDAQGFPTFDHLTG